MNEDLYQQAILDAARAGAENRRLADVKHSATVDNPLCGDRVTFDAHARDGRITDLGFRARGCALCQASTALLAEAGPGLAAGDIADAEGRVRAMLAGQEPVPAAPFHRFAMFTPARAHPSRHACVLLPFEALRAALSPPP